MYICMYTRKLYNTTIGQKTNLHKYTPCRHDFGCWLVYETKVSLHCPSWQQTLIFKRSSILVSSIVGTIGMAYHSQQMIYLGLKKEDSMW